MYKSLKEQIDVALFAGQILSESGAQYEVVTKYVRMLATNLGCEHVEIMVMPTTIVLTITDGNEFRTRIRNTAPIVPDMQKISDVIAICKKMNANKLTIKDITLELEQIANSKPIYPKYMLAIGSGLACGGFALIFHASIISFLLATFSAWCGFWVKSMLQKFSFHWLVVVSLTSLVSTIIPSAFAPIASQIDIETAQAAAVLFLVPGILFIHAVEDILIGYFLVGWARAIHAVTICFGIVTGIALAWQIQRLF